MVLQSILYKACTLDSIGLSDHLVSHSPVFPPLSPVDRSYLEFTFAYPFISTIRPYEDDNDMLNEGIARGSNQILRLFSTPPNFFVTSRFLASKMSIKPLLLAGGNSSRMGSRKELLRLPNSDKLVYIHHLRMLQETCPESEMVYMSLRNRDAVGGLCCATDVTRVSDDTLALRGAEQDLGIRLLFDIDYFGNRDIGPAAGLLAAYYEDPTARWLVAACDFPFLTHAALRQLRDEFVEPVTCFVNSGGFVEPLLGIWMPGALRRLEINVDGGILGPTSVVRQLEAKTIRPVEERWLFNANTKEEWDVATKMTSDHLIGTP